MRSEMRATIRKPSPVPPDLTPEALATWAGEVLAVVALVRQLSEDATAPAGERVRSRKYLRRMLCRRLRDLEARVRVLCPGIAPPTLDPDATPSPE